jgi:hypothetical protein
LAAGRFVLAHPRISPLVKAAVMKQFPTEPTERPPSAAAPAAGRQPSVKVLTQIVLPLVIFVAVVGGTVYFWNFLGKGDSGNKSKPLETKGEPLTFLQRAVIWDPTDPNGPNYPGEFESETSGSYAFWFENKQPEPVEVGLEYKSCNCTQVDVAILTAEEARRYKQADIVQQELQVQAALTGPAGPGGVVQLINFALNGNDGRGGFLGRGPHWQRLNPKRTPEESVVVEPGGGGLVRMAWDGKPGREDLLLLKAELWMQPPGQRKARQITKPPLTALVSFVPTVRVEPRQIEIKDWDGAGRGQAEFTVWSSTREGFPLRARRPKLPASQKDDPCVEEPFCRPLTARECRDLEKKWQDENRFHVSTHVLSGYRVKVTVHQEKNGIQLEQGHFQRWIELTSDVVGSLPAVMVTGTVQGGVEVGDQGTGIIKVGSFAAADGKTTDQIVVWVDGNVELLPNKVEVKPNFMKVRFEKGERAIDRQAWNLWITIPPNAVVGDWPPDSHIMLHTRGANKEERRIRVPVEANPNEGAP